MNERINQHYVPQFYLRNFSYNKNDKSIGLYNIPNEKYVPAYASIKDQAYEKHFYDTDGEIEKDLQKIESNTSQIISQITEEKSLPPLGSDEHITILNFLALQSLRTKYAAKATNEVWDGMIKTVFKNHPEIGKEIENVKFGLRNPASYTIGFTPVISIVMCDLRYKLLKNNTNEPFLTSDHPVVRYNQFLETKKRPGNSTGAALRGLKIFLPLDAETTLLFYDNWAYQIGEPKESIVKLSRPNDVRQLNILQVINADQNLYFDHNLNSIHLQKILEQGMKNRRDNKGRVNEFIASEEQQKEGIKKYVHPDSNEVDENANESLVVSQYEDIRINLKLSFINETMEAKTKEINNDDVLYRDPQLVQMAEEYHESQMEIS